LILLRFTHPGWLSNAWLVGDRDGGSAVVVDSGVPLPPLLEAIRRHRLKVEAILTTHRHTDHVAGHAEMLRRTRAPAWALASESQYVPGARSLRDGDERDWGGLRVRVIALPGHTAGHAGYLIEGAGLFSGDCLFAGSIGGTAGIGASGFVDLRQAIHRILALPDETSLHPGHGDSTTVGREREDNPFVRVLTGVDPEGEGRCAVLGRPALLVVQARDYDGGTKAWVRFDDDRRDVIVPGSRVVPLP
jgi:hydroxyacylglutathione hydrolase